MNNNEDRIETTFDVDALLMELQTLNQGVADENEALEKLTEYIISQDKKEKEAAEKKEAEQKAEEEQAKIAEQELDQISAEKQEKKEEEEAKIAEQEKVESQEITETYTELLTDIRDSNNLSNEIMSGQIFFTGIICGILLVKIFVDRFLKI